ncbi:MAG: sulfite exporter TauE/SafE family protein [bacterium]|nr:MAG: sulfite exporter TauE/SafE family protein [bacterium]
MVEISYLCIVAFLAGFTQGLSGFGSVLVSLPLLAVIYDIRTVVPLVSLFALCITTTLVIQLHEHMSLKRISPLLVAAVPGMAFGAYLLKHARSGYLEFLIGVLLVSFSIYSLSARPRERELSHIWKWVAGFLSGILGGSIGANGPPVIIYTSLQPWGKNPIKSTLVGYFMVAGIGISSIHAAYRLITLEVLRMFAIGLAPVMAGVLTGSYLFGRIDTTTYRKVVTFLLFALGVYMLMKVGKGIVT